MPSRARNCLGRFWRESGQKRSPRPPARITGTMGADMAAPPRAQVGEGIPGHQAQDLPRAQQGGPMRCRPQKCGHRPAGDDRRWRHRRCAGASPGAHPGPRKTLSGESESIKRRRRAFFISTGGTNCCGQSVSHCTPDGGGRRPGSVGSAGLWERALSIKCCARSASVGRMRMSW